MGFSPARPYSAQRATSTSDVHDHWAAAIGALLAASPVPDAAAAELQRCLEGGDPWEELAGLGIRREAVEALRPLLPAEPRDVALGVALGRAWLHGRASIRPLAASWSPVFSGADLDPRTHPRLTAETLIYLIGTARHEICIATAYVDRGGVEALLPCLKAAAQRGTAITFAAVARLDREAALDHLRRELGPLSRPDDLAIVRLEATTGFPHLKVLVADRRRAYLGSANFTLPGMTTNLEVGALVEGPGAASLHEFTETLVRAFGSS